jgi:apolipoprotein N-acyltransferase
MRSSLRLLLAFASGTALTFAFPPYSFGVLAWISLALLLGILLGARRRTALACGFAHGAAFHLFSVPWIYTVMRVHGGLGRVEAGGVFALLVAVLALYPAVFAFAVAHVARHSPARALAASPFFLVAMEYVRGHFPDGGFPWNLLGYAGALHLGLLQLAAITGIYGLSFVVAAFNALVAWVFLVRSRRSFLIGAVTTAIAVSAVLVGDQFVPREKPDFVAALVQTNFPESPEYPSDWMDQHAGEMDELERLSIGSAEAVHGITVWPEAPAPFYWQDPKFSTRMAAIARATGNHVLTGVVDWKRAADGRLLPYNTVILIDPSGRRVFSYDKIHLVPFGEYVPLRRWLTFVEKLTVEVGEFQPGTVHAVGEIPGGRFGVAICYEAIYPDEIRRFVTGGARLLINVSNDGWFGGSAAGEQHLFHARVRAVENRRWLLRDTNTGFTASVDPYGRVVALLQTDVRGALAAPYSFRGDLTPYTRWGDWFAFLCIAAALAVLVGTTFRGQKG